MTILQEVERLAPEIAKRADEIEEARRLPADLAQSFAKAGLMRMLVPKSVGGHELSPREAVEAIEAVARIDASAAWCVMIAATTGLTGAYLPPDLAREVFADPMTITGGVFAPMGKAVREGDEYVVDGRWKWGSGTQNCRWIVGGSVIIENGAMRTLPNGSPDHRMMIFPASDVEFFDTWHVTGLKGTGSVEFAVKGARVPVARSVSLIVDQPVEQGPTYRFPAFGFLAIGIAAVAGGNAAAALEDLKSLARTKKPGGSSRSLAERGATQAAFAQAHAVLAAARAWFYATIDKAWGAAQSGAISKDIRGQLRLAATHLTRTAAESARMAYDLAGGDAVFLKSPLQRRFRDAHVATQHMMVSPNTYELTGRVLLDLETDESTL
ncbi:MAG: acyl-CoA dehydrogenase family protein [Hyphomonadaceae bacterium]